MPKLWLSENHSPGSTTAVILGPVDEQALTVQCSKHPDGVLWITVEGETDAPCPALPNLKQIIVDPTASDFPEDTLESFLGLNYKVMPSIRVSGEINPESEAYAKILDFVMLRADTALRARRTRSENGPLRQRNVFRNLAGYLRSRIPDAWRGRAEGSLVVVVGAGPSLDLTLPLIKEGFDRPVVIAADSALRALLLHGISPDFVVNVDPEKSLQSCGFPDHCPGIAVVSSQSHPSWQEAWGENTCYLSGRVLTEDWLAEKGIAKTSFQAINNAGLTALLLADFLGAGAIMLLGMDLSGDGRLRYARATGRGRVEITSSNYHKVPGNHDETVSTPFLSDWKETSEHCATVATRRYLINLNDRGAQLEGAVVIHPDKIADLREALSENLQPIDREAEPFGSSREVETSGLDQIIRLLATRCDEIWQAVDPVLADGSNASQKNKLQFFHELLGQQEHATLLGDYAFAVMPDIMPGKEPSDSQLDLWLNELRQILWLLEDALVATKPSEEFLARFLAKVMA